MSAKWPRLLALSVLLVVAIQSFLHFQDLDGETQIRDYERDSSLDFSKEPSVRVKNAQEVQSEEIERKKKICEMNYWERKKEGEGSLSNTHYQSIYTRLSELTVDSYKNKKILDIGCGPRGPLEWAAPFATAIVCVDPLAKECGKLGASDHQMTYIHSGSEDIPIPSNSFDIVTSINNLDHVTNVTAALSEISRIVRVGGFFLLYVHLHPIPKPCEPQSMNFGIVEQIKSQGFEISWRRDTEYSVAKNCTTRGTVVSWTCSEYDHTDPQRRDAYLALRATRLPD